MELASLLRKANNDKAELLATLHHLAALPDTASHAYVRNHAAAAIAKSTGTAS